MRHGHTIVVGAGVVGVSIAASLLRRDERVTLVTRDLPGSQTTSTTYAWINSHKKTPHEYHRLNTEGVKFWRTEIASKYPNSVKFNGHLVIASSARHKEILSNRLTMHDEYAYPYVELSCEEAQKQVPFPLPAGARVIHFSEEGHADPQAYVKALISELRKQDKYDEVLAQVRSIDLAKSEVVLEEAISISADRIVIAAGHGSSRLAKTAGVQLPLITDEVGGAAFGYLAYIDAPHHGLRQLITMDTISIRPDTKHRLLAQALDLDSFADPHQAVPEHVRIEFGQRLIRLFPQIQQSDIEVRTGHRVIPADGLSVVGRLVPASQGNLWACVTHSGIVLGPWLGEALATEITTGFRDPLLDSFRPSRFTNDNTLSDYSPPREPGDQ